MLSQGSHCEMGKDPGFLPQLRTVKLRAAPRTWKSLLETPQGTSQNWTHLGGAEGSRLSLDSGLFTLHCTP